MTKYVALLRGINVGGNNKVDMKKLKKIMEEASFQNVLTYINSGNVIFESAESDKTKLANKVEMVLERAFGSKIRVVVRSKADMKKLVAKIPKDWKNGEGQKTDVLFLWDEFDNKKSLALFAHTPEIDNLIYVAGAIVWNIEFKNYNRSGMHKFIGSLVYKHMTARNVNTTRKLLELMEN